MSGGKMCYNIDSKVRWYDLKILICDDNFEIVKTIKAMVEESLQKLGQADNEYILCESGEELLATGEVGDIALLDVEMAGISGILTGEELKKRNPRIKIIIVTSYADYLDEAMKFHVFRYLSKPVDKDRLYRCLKDAINRISNYSKTAIVKADGEHIKVYTEDILSIETSGRGTLIHLTDRDICSAQGIEQWAQILDIPCFYEASRGYIVNMKYVQSFDSISINLAHNDKVVKAYISRRKYKEFKTKYLLFVRTDE